MQALSGLGGLSGLISNIAYLFRSQFLPSVSAPITNPYAAETGGNWATTDTESKLFTLLSRLRGGGQATPVWGDAKLVGPGFSRVQGRALAALISIEDYQSDLAIHWSTSSTPTDPRTVGHGWVSEDGKLEVISPGVKAVLDSGNKAIKSMQYYAVIVLQSSGAYVLLSSFASDSGGLQAVPLYIPQYPSARLLYVETSDTTATLYPALSFYDLGAGTAYPNGHAVEDVRVVDVISDSAWSTLDGLATVADRFTRSDSSTALGNGWSVDGSGLYGISSNQAYSPSGASSFVRAWKAGLSDGIIVCDITHKNGQYGKGVMVRRQDASNYIRIWDNGGNTIAIQTFVSGAFGATVASTAFTWSNDTTYRLMVAYQGNQYRVWINGTDVFGSWRSDSNNRFLTATGVGLYANNDGGNTRWDNFGCYPHILTLPYELKQGIVPRVLTGGATIGQDTFTDTNAVRLNAHTAETGGAWTERTGTWTVQSNRASVALASGNNFATQNLGTANAELSLDIITPASLPTPCAMAGIVFHYVDANNFHFARIRQYTDQLSNDEIELHEYIGGTGNVVKKVNLGAFFTTSTTYTLKVQAYNDLIYIYLNGIPYITYYTQTGSPAGSNHGIYRQGSSTPDDGCVFDNWSVKFF